MSVIRKVFCFCIRYISYEEIIQKLKSNKLLYELIENRGIEGVFNLRETWFKTPLFAKNCIVQQKTQFYLIPHIRQTYRYSSLVTKINLYSFFRDNENRCILNSVINLKGV
jgi:hypothetical protein